MALRLFLSAALALLVMIGCPVTEPPGPSRAPLSVLAPMPAAVQVLPAPATDARPEAQPPQAKKPRRARQARRRASKPEPPPAPVVEVPEGLPLHRDLVAGRILGALSKETVVRAEPRPSARKLGFLRQGALVRREPQAAGHEGCPGGWYRVAPEGYVCVGKTATLDASHPLLQLTSRRPDRAAPLPYLYGRARFPTPPLYTRLPTAQQQALVELDLVAQQRRTRHFAAWDDAPIAEVPELLARGERVPRPFGYPVLERDFVSGSALPETGFAFLELYEHGGRRWGLTTDLSVVPLDRVEPVRASEFHGIQLSKETPLPVVFVRSKGAYLYRGDPRSSGLVIERPLGHREAVPITGTKLRLTQGTYLETRSGHWILDQHLVRIDPMLSKPRWADRGQSWIEVSILQQSLVAYRGEEPVYATLVSTGIGGLGDPKETQATIRGTFLIHTKHVTATMSNDEVGDEFDLRDVPYVQYFQDGYAFHAAYWHDAFGSPRSHGCINLSPADARWLFHFTGPAVPRAWHSALSLREGTLVYIHP
ncbi:MAG TPA: L,D-transpeptidase [Polyangiaceae bacterium]